jgi:hypothetical protein
VPASIYCSDCLDSTSDTIQSTEYNEEYKQIRHVLDSVFNGCLNFGLHVLMPEMAVLAVLAQGVAT